MPPPRSSRVRQSRSKRSTENQSNQKSNNNHQSTNVRLNNNNKLEEQEEDKSIQSMAKFQKHQNEAKESIQRMLQDLSDSSDEETEESLSRAESIQKAMRGEYSGDDSYYEKATQNLQTTCVVCLEKVRTKDSIWQCDQCYCLLHLTCTQRWAKSCYCEETGGNEDENGNWVCPKCRNLYPKREIPRTYLCFCGKVENPPIDLWIVSHSVSIDIYLDIYLDILFRYLFPFFFFCFV